MAAYGVTTAAALLEFDTQIGSGNSCFQIDDNHFINFGQGGANRYGTAQVFTVNTSTGATTTANSSLEFNAVITEYNTCAKIDDNHFINFYHDAGSLDGFVQVVAVNTSTGAVTTAGAILEFDTADDAYNSCCQVDANHFINFWSSVDSDGFAQIFTVDTSTWAVTTANAKLEFDTQRAIYNKCSQIDDTHFINVGCDIDDDGIAQVFAVNTSTGAVTTAGAIFEFDTRNYSDGSLYKVDDNHFIIFRRGVDLDGFSEVLEINTTTGAVSTKSAALEFDTQTGTYNSCSQLDSTHYINFWSGDDSNDGYVQVFAVNTSTGAITTAAASLEFDTTQNGVNSCYKIDTNHFINFGQGPANDGFVQTFAVELAASGPANLKTINTNTKANTKTINTNTIANTKTYNTVT